jgi:NAD(P)-dependent dehydrogenase (short-subunit alcohol dehydrogenase family)
LQGHRALVFGASSGVGRATAEALAAEGAEVVLVGRDAERLEQARHAVGDRARAIVGDGADLGSIERAFDEAGELDHLVIPAGQTSRGGLFGQELSLEKLRDTFEGKFWVQMAVAHRGAARVKRGGSITFVSGGAAHRALIGMVNIAAVNGAIEAAVPPLARELAPTRVNAVSPGTLDTGYWRGVPDDQREAIFARTAEALPAGRVGTGADIAAAMLFLVLNTFVTGVVLPVDGGIALSNL